MPVKLPTPPDHCHFMTPVRFGRRRTDQVGHLAMTTTWLTFRGTVELSVSWAEISNVQHAGRDVIVSLQGTRRLLRFCCPGDEEAMRGAVIARHLTEIVHSDPFQTV
jgi:hypothetical protein